MSYDEFLVKIKDVINEWWVDKGYIEIKWTTGGRQGGSCWDTGKSVYYPVTPEAEPEFEVLDTILEEMAPAITFIQYKAISRLIERGSGTDYEYYGNSTSYATKRIQLKSLYKFLLERDFI